MYFIGRRKRWRGITLFLSCARRYFRLFHFKKERVASVMPGIDGKWAAVLRGCFSLASAAPSSHFFSNSCQDWLSFQSFSLSFIGAIVTFLGINV